jgi:hypothetical protein
VAKTEFTENELKHHLFVQFVAHPDGPNGRRTDFHGFFTDEALIRCRNVRNMFGPMGGSSGRMSEYLFFLAELFRESENQALSAPVALSASRLDKWSKCPAGLPDTTCPATRFPCTQGCFDGGHSAGYCGIKAAAEHPNMARWETEGP